MLIIYVLRAYIKGWLFEEAVSVIVLSCARGREEVFVMQAAEDGIRPGGRRDRYVLTVRGDSRIPSFTRNSLAMRSSPHGGFSFAFRRIRA
jgi:hypothetical protein